MTFGAFAKGPEFVFPFPPQAVKNTEATRTNAGLEFIAFPIRDKLDDEKQLPQEAMQQLDDDVPSPRNGAARFLRFNLNRVTKSSN